MKNSVTRYVYPEGERAFAPHCDPSVLHAPGVCEFCDHYSDWQAYRKVARIAFTGEEPGEFLAPCPTKYLRKSDPHDWPGNTPEGYGDSFITTAKSWFR